MCGRKSPSCVGFDYHLIIIFSQILTSFFRKLYVRRKNVPASTTTAVAAPTPTALSLAASKEDDDEAELDLTLEREETNEEATARVAFVCGQEVLDTAKVMELRDVAIQDMRAVGLVISDDHAKAAINLITKVRVGFLPYFGSPLTLSSSLRHSR